MRPLPATARQTRCRLAQEQERRRHGAYAGPPARPASIFPPRYTRRVGDRPAACAAAARSDRRAIELSRGEAARLSSRKPSFAGPRGYTRCRGVQFQCRKEVRSHGRRGDPNERAQPGRRLHFQVGRRMQTSGRTRLLAGPKGQAQLGKFAIGGRSAHMSAGRGRDVPRTSDTEVGPSPAQEFNAGVNRPPRMDRGGPYGHRSVA